MKHHAPSPSAPFLSVFASPIGRLDSAKVVGVIAAAAQYLITDAFAGAFILVIFASVFDYWIGVKAAKAQTPSAYNSQVAHRGWLGKMSGFALLLLIRALEYYVQGQGLPATHGALATGVAISLFAVELQSIAHHREELGGGSIPLLSDLVAWLNRFASSRIPPQ